MWPLQRVREFSFFSPSNLGQVLETPVCPGERGQHFHICLFISRKVMMDFISLTHRFVIKCQILSEAVHVSRHRCFFESRVIAILGNCPAASCVYQHSSACLSPSLLCSPPEAPLSNRQPFRVLSALASQPTVCPVQDRPGPGRARPCRWSLPQAWVACSIQPEAVRWSPSPQGRL